MRSVILTALLLPVAMAFGAVSWGAEGEVPIIYSTDLYHPHGDPDDHFDLATLFSLGEFDIRGIVLDGGERQKKAPGKIPLEQMFHLTGRTAPYAIGLEKPLSSPEDTGEKQPAEFQKGVELILDALRKSPKKVMVVTTGSLRDVAAALNRDPELVRSKVERLYMAIGNAGGAEQFEHNVKLDPQSYVRIMQSGLPIYWCPCFDGGLWKREHGYATYWRFAQGDVLGSVKEPLKNWFVFALMRLQSDDPIAAITQPMQGDQWMQIWPTARNMWSTVALLDAAGRQIYQRPNGAFVPLSPQDATAQKLTDRKVEVYRFDPVAVTVVSNEGSKICLKIDLKPQQANMKISHVVDPRYDQIMTDCLKSLLSGVGK